MAEQDAQDQVDQNQEPTEEEQVAELIVEAEEEENASADEFEEAEVEGKKVKVTKGFKDYLLREDDYRRKTHEIGESRRSVEAEKRAVVERAQLHEKFIEEVAEVRGLDKQLEEYKKITPEQWINWRAQDKDAADNAQFAWNTLLQRRNDLGSQIQGKIEAEKNAQSRQQSEWAAQQEAILKTKIKDWSPEKETALKSHVAERFGFDPNELAGIKDPRIMQVLDYLHRQDGAIKAAREKAAKLRSENNDTPITPVTKVTGSSTNVVKGPTARLVKDNPEAFDREFAAQRMKHLNGRTR